MWSNKTDDDQPQTSEGIGMVSLGGGLDMIEQTQDMEPMDPDEGTLQQEREQEGASPRGDTYQWQMKALQPPEGQSPEAQLQWYENMERQQGPSFIPLYLKKVHVGGPVRRGKAGLSLGAEGHIDFGMFDFCKAMTEPETPATGGSPPTRRRGPQRPRPQRPQRPQRPRRPTPGSQTLRHHPANDYTGLTHISVQTKPKATACTLPYKLKRSVDPRPLYPVDQHQWALNETKQTHSLLPSTQQVVEKEEEEEKEEEDKEGDGDTELDKRNAMYKTALQNRSEQVLDWVRQRQTCVGNVQDCMREIATAQQTQSDTLRVMVNRMRFLISELQDVTVHTVNAVEEWQAMWREVEGNEGDPPAYMYQGQDLIASLDKDLRFLKKSFIVRQWMNEDKEVPYVGVDAPTTSSAESTPPLTRESSFFITEGRMHGPRIGGD